MVACPGECHIQLSVDDVAALSEAVGGEELHLPCVVHGERIDDDVALSGQPFGYVVRTIRKKSDLNRIQIRFQSPSFPSPARYIYINIYIKDKD